MIIALNNAFRIGGRGLSSKGENGIQQCPKRSPKLFDVSKATGVKRPN